MIPLIYKLSNLLRFISIDKLSSLSGNTIIFPFYHIVSDDDAIHIKHLYKVKKVDTFIQEMDFLLKEYTPLDIDDFHNRNYDVKKKYFVLSFDDGLREFHDVVAPILLKKGIPAINFLNSNFIDNKGLFFRYKTSILLNTLRDKGKIYSIKQSVDEWFFQNKMSTKGSYASLYSINYNNQGLLDTLADLLEIDFEAFLKKEKPYMSSEQILSLIKQGFKFGAHSVSHPQYSDIDIEDQLSETLTCISDLKEKLGIAIDYFSFPFTDDGVRKEFFNKIHNSINLSFGTAGMKKDVISNNIQRIPMEIDGFNIKEILYGEHIAATLKSLLRKNIIQRK